MVCNVSWDQITVVIQILERIVVAHRKPNWCFSHPRTSIVVVVSKIRPHLVKCSAVGTYQRIKTFAYLTFVWPNCVLYALNDIVVLVNDVTEFWSLFICLCCVLYLISHQSIDDQCWKWRLQGLSLLYSWQFPSPAVKTISLNSYSKTLFAKTKPDWNFSRKERRPLSQHRRSMSGLSLLQVYCGIRRRILRRG